MSVSTFDLFKIGIGPSSSHTVGPMIAACRFARRLEEYGVLTRVAAVRVELHGSLGATGKGHGSDKAVLLGLEGNLPDRIDPDYAMARLDTIRAERSIALLGTHAIPFVEKTQLMFYRQTAALPQHPNGMRFVASDADGQELLKREYYSVGGGFVVNCEGRRVNGTPDGAASPYPFRTGAELLALCAASGLTIPCLMFENEKTWRSEDEIRAALRAIW